MVLNLTLIKETMEEVLILTPITLHQSRALLKNPRLPQNIPKSLQITKDCFKIWVNMGRYELVLCVTGSVVLTQYRAILVGTWWNWVSKGRYWLVLDVTGSVKGGTGLYLVALGQYGALLVDTWWYMVRRRQHWLVVGGAGSVWNGTDWYLVVLGQYSLILLGI